MQDSGDVVGIPEPASGDEAGQQGIDVVLVRFGPPQLGSESPEGG